jgi:ectoine hydroxylase
MPVKQLRQYDEHGYVSLGTLFSAVELELLAAEVGCLAERETAGRVFERDGTTIRALHGCHRESAVMSILTRVSRLLAPVTDVLRSPAYVYQFKIHFKAAFSGDVWKWHQDYIYWRDEDGMPEPRAVNVALFLDDVTEFNGPIIAVPHSHTCGVIEVEAAVAPTATGPPADWQRHVSANLPYTLDTSTVRRLASRHGLVSIKGEPGTVVLFHPNLAHASAANMSPYGRRTILITYNSTANIPVGTGERRPEFLVSHDTRPLSPLADDLLR